MQLTGISDFDNFLWTCSDIYIDPAETKNGCIGGKNVYSRTVALCSPAGECKIY